MYLAVAPPRAPGAPSLAAAPDDSAVQAALDWIKGNYRDYLALGSKIGALRARAAHVEAVSTAADPERARAAAILQDGLDGLHRRWRWTADQMRWVVSKIPGLGAWLVPVAVSGVALIVAGVAVVIIHDYRRAELGVEAIERGVLTVEQARALGLDLGGSPLVQFSAGAWTAMAAGGLAFWWATRKKGRRR